MIEEISLVIFRFNVYFKVLFTTNRIKEKIYDFTMQPAIKT